MARHTHNHLEPGHLCIVEGLVNLGLVLHVDHARPIQIQSCAPDLLRHGLELRIGCVQRHVHTLECDAFEAQTFGHGNHLCQIELAQRIGGDAQAECRVCMAGSARRLSKRRGRARCGQRHAGSSLQKTASIKRCTHCLAPRIRIHRTSRIKANVSLTFRVRAA